jgi:hypothetical protein
MKADPVFKEAQEIEAARILLYFYFDGGDV